MTTDILFCLLILTSNLATVKSTQECEADSHVNGCSVPLGLDTPFKHTFTKACDKHDICYGCGYHYTWSRADCDASFLRDMKMLCHQAERHHGYLSRRRRFIEALMELWEFFHGISKTEKRCRMMADMYYDGVRVFAESHFEKMDNRYCNSSCARKHGSPFVPLRMT